MMGPVKKAGPLDEPSRDSVAATPVAVAFICDRHYVVPTAVAIASLLHHRHRDTRYEIYVVAADPSVDLGILGAFDAPGAAIHPVEAPPGKYAGIPDSFHVTSAACLKFDLPHLLPHLDKVLYLDGDVLVREDLRALYETGLGDRPAAVVRDIGLEDNALGIPSYFNAGVMLLNLKQVRKEGAPAALEEMRRTRTDLTYMDQDCSNLLFAGRVRLLPMRYNCFYSIFLRLKRRYPVERINRFFGTSYPTLEALGEDAAILHLAGHDKPWLYFDSVSTPLWDRYRALSPARSCKLRRRSIRLRPIGTFARYLRRHGPAAAAGLARRKLLALLRPLSPARG
jgi:lipopolysaccharide biosynthesis glycosyltransferase